MIDNLVGGLLKPDEPYWAKMSFESKSSRLMDISSPDMDHLMKGLFFTQNSEVIRRNITLLSEEFYAKSETFKRGTCSFICQGTSTRRQRRNLFGVESSFHTVTTSLTVQRYKRQSR